MPDHRLAISIIPDTVAPNLPEALEACVEKGVHAFVVRDGEQAPFPFLTSGEIRAIEETLRRGGRIVAVAPALFQGCIEDRPRLADEFGNGLPRTIDLARHVESPMLIVAGWERYEGEPEANRLFVLRALEQVAEAAADAGLLVAIKNRKGCWVDLPEASMALLDELRHPSVKLCWDPADLLRGTFRLHDETFHRLQPHLAGLWLKDFNGKEPERTDRPVGQGVVPWKEILAWAAGETHLTHLTLATHCDPLGASLAWLQEHLAPASIS